MDASKAGVVIPKEGEGSGAGAGQEDQHSNDGAGTGDAAKSPAKKPEGEGAGTDGGADGTGEGEGAGDPKDKRINDLMSKWQGEESSHHKTKSKLQIYEEKFGPLDEHGQPVQKAKPKAEPVISDEDPDMPAALKPGWSPHTMEELQEGLRQAALYGAQIADRNISQRTQTTEQARQDAQQQLDDFVSEIKIVDAEFDEQVFFQYANEHKFPVNTIKDLRAVYSSYVSLERAKRGAVEKALDNKGKRVNPVNKPGAGQGGSGGVPFSKISQATSAKDLISDMIANNRK